MIALIQRVSQARVEVESDCIGRIGVGLLALIAVQPDDAEPQVEKLCERLLNYRVFSDSAGKMNQSLRDIDGGLLLVPQFTLAADTRRGLRPSFTTAAPPERAQHWFLRLVALAQERHSRVAQGQFGADMKVSLTNDGPVTFWLTS